MPIEENNRAIALLRELFPDYTEKQLEEADQHFERYLKVVLRIHERIKDEQKDP